MKRSSSLSVCLFAFGLGAHAGFGQAPVALHPAPLRVVGHPLPESINPSSGTSPNLVEGREFFGPQGIALDNSVTPPILYVADTGNNRVLGWRDATSFRNGQTADLVIGQNGFYQSRPQGPGTTFTTGLNAPTGLLVSSNGDLYIADSGNNRILRFPKPFNNIGNQLPNLYIGQPNISTGRANYTGTVGRQGLSLAGFTSYMAIDSSGNLWVTDPGNRRVLQFLAAAVASGGGPLSANIVIGQANFETVQPAVNAPNRTKADAFATPSSIAFDSAGRLYVTDFAISGNAYTVSRVLVFNPPFNNAMSASRLMGVFPGNAPSQDALDRTAMLGPEGIFFMPNALIPTGGKMAVVDSASNRILLFDTYDNWPDQATTFSPLATGVIGQSGFRVRGINGANLVAKAGSFFGPTAVAFSGSELFVADSGNNRVLALPLVEASFGEATRVLGQDFFHGQAINLIEGREFQFLSAAGGAEAGIAIDNSRETPRLYVADTYNNRILGFADARKVQAGVKADLVIGQEDFTTNLCNFHGLNSPDTGNPDRPTQSSLCTPIGLLTDSAGNLYVADAGNSRVLRFPSPFDFPGPLPQADLVLGQQNFTSKITDPTPSTMSAPYGLAWAGTSGLLVSDTNHNRVLYFRFSPEGTFNAPDDNFKAATKVFGQPNFNSNGRGNTDSTLSNPRHISTDTDARLYVTDTANNRVMIFDQVTTNATPEAGAPAVRIVTGFSAPRGVFVNSFTGEFWVGDNNTNGQVRKFPRLASLASPPAANGQVISPTVLSLVQDNLGNLAIADVTSRVSFYFPGAQVYNGATFNPNQRLAPGTFATLCTPGSNCEPTRRVSQFGSATEANGSLPYPKSLGDIEVQVGGVPAPLTYVSPTQINFVVPKSAPASGETDVVVVQKSTGRVYSGGYAGMNTYSPGIFTTDFGAPTRQAAVINMQDGTVNSPDSCAARGSYISIFANGYGILPDAPPDGERPPGLVRTPFTPKVWINTGFVDELPLQDGDPPRNELIQFSGMSPEFPGVWQINVWIPKIVGIGNQVPLFISAGSLTSQDFQVTGYRTTICVKQ